MVSGRKNSGPREDVELPAPAKTLEGRENQLINLAYDLVEQRLRNGDATSQETTYFLKAGSSMGRKEKEQLEARVELLQGQVEQLRSNARLEEKYDEAIAAMRSYSGQEPGLDDPEYYDE